MENYSIKKETLTNVANAIREKTGEEGEMTPLEMPEKIKKIQANTTSGLTTVQINALDAMFKVAAYTENPSSVYAAFRVAFGLDTSSEKYTIVNNLTNAKNSNSAVFVEKGSSYSAVITANDGYVLEKVTCTMGGQEQAVMDGNISIESVTGDIIIVATTKPSESQRTVYILEDDSSVVKQGYMNKNGSIGLESNGRYKYAEIPYFSGMEIYLRVFPSTLNDFPPVVVYENGEYKVPAYESVSVPDTLINQKVVVSGYSDGTKVYANMYDSSKAFSDAKNYYYVKP